MLLFIFFTFFFKIKKEQVEIKQEESTWNVLRDDFIPQVSMRDWDKQESSDSEND